MIFFNKKGRRGREGYTGEDAAAKIQREAVADLVGDYLFTDPDFVSRLSTENRNVFQKIFDEIKYLCRVATAGSKEARELEKVKKMFEEAYRADAKNPTSDGGNQYSLMAFEQDGRRFVEIDQEQDRFDGHSEDEYPRIAKDIINEKFNGKIIGIDNKMFVNGSGRDEFANPSKHLSGDLYEAKMRSAGELDNLLDAGTNYRKVPDGADGHYHPDVIDGFDHWDTLFKIGDRYYEAVVNIKNVKKGKLFKDVTKIKDVTQDIMDSYGDNPKFQFLRTSSMNSIRDSDEVVNNKKSLSAMNQTDDHGPFSLPWKIQGEDVRYQPTEEGQGAQTGKKAAKEPGMDLLIELLDEIRERNSGEADAQAQDMISQQPQREFSIEALVGDKGSFLSKNADMLYAEISGLKKGVKASDRLGYILDHGYEWRSVKTALLNIRDNPNEAVNPNSQAEGTLK